ncbi:hypothetical protein AS29_018045 [Bacillus sp. SJS]|nr:hypothetical protein AS29_018045 [Bacillus sp. SJS]
MIRSLDKVCPPEHGSTLYFIPLLIRKIYMKGMCPSTILSFPLYFANLNLSGAVNFLEKAMKMDLFYEGNCCSFSC